MSRFYQAARFAAALGLSCVALSAAQAQDFFVPNQPRAAPAAPAPRPAPPRPAPSRPAPPPVQIAPQPPVQQGARGGQPDAPLAQVQLPPLPDLPPLPKGTSPPAAVVGVMGVPEVMHVATAAQQVEKVIGERREKLNADAQKEQNVWREMQQSLANERAKLPPEQIRNRERDLQERITNAQKQFRDRNTVIQQAAQVALAQIERTLIAVIRQVAESRGMNLVLHRAQVALNVNEFDITDQVADQLNKVLPSVQIPPDGVSPLAMQGGAASGDVTPASVSPAQAGGGAAAIPLPAPPRRRRPRPRRPAARGGQAGGGSALGRRRTLFRARRAA